MKLAAVLVVTTTALAVPGSAIATPGLAGQVPDARTAQVAGTDVMAQPLNLASDRLALAAYASYLGILVKDLPTAQTADTTYISTISSQCKSALVPLTQPNEQVNAAAQATLTALGEELGGDLSVTFDSGAAFAFDRLSAALSHLRWTRLSGGNLIVRHYIATETAVLAMMPSDLCQDALLAASSPQIIPAGTRSFLKTYNRVSSQANVALANFLRLLQTYETPYQKATVARIAGLAAEVTKVTKADLLQSATALTAALET